MSATLESYYLSVRRGSLACIHRTDMAYGDQYIFTRVLDASNGHIKTQYGTFWAINGERIDKRWNGDENRLVIPTMSRLEAEEANLASLYQFGTDRKFELAAARAVLERRSTKMPTVPPPPIPTLEEAEAELRDATNHWMSVDQILDSPSNSVRARREASDRLAAAKTNFALADKRHKNSSRQIIKSSTIENLAHSAPPAKNRHNRMAPEDRLVSLNSYKYNTLGNNNLDAAQYTFSLSVAISLKTD